MVHSGAAHHRQADASQTRRDQGGAEPHASRAGARTGALAGAGGARLSRVPRRADQFAEDHVLPIPRRVALATRALAPKPEGSRHVGADRTDRRALAATRQDQPSLAATPLPRQTPEVGAECVSSARSDLSGGRRVKPASLPGWEALVHGSAWGRPGDFVVMANLGCHASAAVRYAVEVKRAGLRVPPPHSPDFNSNRECFCEAQATPPKAAARTLDAHRRDRRMIESFPPTKTATTLPPPDSDTNRVSRWCASALAAAASGRLTLERAGSKC